MNFLILKRTSDHEISFICHYENKEDEYKAHFKILNFLFGEQGCLKGSMYSIFNMNITKTILKQKKRKSRISFARSPERTINSTIENFIDRGVNAIPEEQAIEENAQDQTEEDLSEDLDKKFQDMEESQSQLLFEKVSTLIETRDEKSSSAVFRSVINMNSVRQNFFLEEKEY